MFKKKGIGMKLGICAAALALAAGLAGQALAQGSGSWSPGGFNGQAGSYSPQYTQKPQVGEPCPPELVSGNQGFDKAGNTLTCIGGTVHADSNTGTLNVDKEAMAGASCGDHAATAAKMFMGPSKMGSGMMPLLSCFPFPHGKNWSTFVYKPAPPRKEDIPLVYCPSGTQDIHDRSRYWDGYYNFRIDGQCNTFKMTYDCEIKKGHISCKLVKTQYYGQIAKGFTAPGQFTDGTSFVGGFILGDDIKSLGLNASGLLFAPDAKLADCSEADSIAGLCTTGFDTKQTHIAPWLY